MNSKDTGQQVGLDETGGAGVSGGFVSTDALLT